jgi:processive 1,2-diacylglycerol beta-glucosyltransferase/1,2-diacylglycerol 3-beta-galactosyltransferase
MPDDTAKERILFLYLPTGGGHLAPARALARRIEAVYGVDTRIECPVLSRVGLFIFKDGYQAVSQVFPALWKVMYERNEKPWGMRLSRIIAGFFTLHGLRRVIAEYRPTKIVCVHHLMVRALRIALKEYGRVPTVMVVTDPFEPHPIWAFNHFWPLACYSEDAAKTLVRYGVTRDRISVHSLIVNESFERPVGREELDAFKAELGLRVGKPMVLIAGGADGMKRAEAMTLELLQSRLDFDLAVVCGRDPVLKLKVETVVAAHRLVPSSKKKTAVLGFTDRMPLLMRAADAIASKAGASVVAEILRVGKPNIVAYMIPGQEKGNVDFVVSHGLGLYCRTPKSLRLGVERILGDDAYRKRIEANIASLHFRNGLDSICKSIMELE